MIASYIIVYLKIRGSCSIIPSLFLRIDAFFLTEADTPNQYCICTYIALLIIQFTLLLSSTLNQKLDSTLSYGVLRNWTDFQSDLVFYKISQPVQIGCWPWNVNKSPAEPVIFKLTESFVLYAGRRMVYYLIVSQNQFVSN